MTKEWEMIHLKALDRYSMLHMPCINAKVIEERTSDYGYVSLFKTKCNRCGKKAPKQLLITRKLINIRRGSEIYGTGKL